MKPFDSWVQKGLSLAAFEAAVAQEVARADVLVIAGHAALALAFTFALGAHAVNLSADLLAAGILDDDIVIRGIQTIEEFHIALKVEIEAQSLAHRAGGVLEGKERLGGVASVGRFADPGGRWIGQIVFDSENKGKAVHFHRARSGIGSARRGNHLVRGQWESA